MIDDLRKGVPCPPEARTLHLAERFHCPPWDIEQAPADRVMFWLQVMSVEAEVSNAREDMKSDEELVWDDGEDED